MKLRSLAVLWAAFALALGATATGAYAGEGHGGGHDGGDHSGWHSGGDSYGQSHSGDHQGDHQSQSVLAREDGLSRLEYPGAVAPGVDAKRFGFGHR